MAMPQVATDLDAVKLWASLLITPLVTLKAVIWRRAGGEISAIGAGPALLFAGQPLFAGGLGASAVATAVGTLVSLSVPSAFFAVTTTRSVVLLSADFSV